MIVNRFLLVIFNSINQWTKNASVIPFTGEVMCSPMARAMRVVSCDTGGKSVIFSIVFIKYGVACH